jgi:xanthine dehydrogenase accessory factor
MTRVSKWRAPQRRVAAAGPHIGVLPEVAPARVPSLPDPDRAVLDHLMRGDGEVVLAVIAGTEGPSYRPVGAMMAIGADGVCTGSLSSGCIEADLVVQARQALATNQALRLRYGAGSPWIDLRLPCGGGLDILLCPRPARKVIAALSAHLDARRPITMAIDPQGELALQADGETGMRNGSLFVRFIPPIAFDIFGSGVEALAFASLVQSLGYRGTLRTQERRTLEAAEACGLPASLMKSMIAPAGWSPDDRTAIVLFFHDHDWEPVILNAALASKAFYIGAQGSKASRHARDEALLSMGQDRDDLARICGPIGLIPSARDPRTLAVSVLAEVMEAARQEA